MATYKLRVNVSLTPTEEVTLNDGSTVSYNVHSDIDRSVSSGVIKSYSTTSTNILYDTYLTTASGVALSDATILNVNPTMDFLFIRIASAGSSGTPDCLITFDNTNYHIKLTGVGDFCVIPFEGNTYALNASDIKILSSGSTAVSNIEIIVGKV